MQLRRIRRRIVNGLFAAGLMAAAPAAAREVDADMFEALRAADVALAAAGFRLSAAAAPLCDRKQPGTGIQFHTLAQFAPEVREDARRHFGFAGGVAVEGVVPASPAARAGIRADDTVISINGQAAPAGAEGAASTDILAGLHRQLAQYNPSAPLVMLLLRDGERVEKRIVPVPACDTRFELQIDDGFGARANGELVQISSKYLEKLDSQLLPVVTAHELAHNILHHRARLEAAGADFGTASGFGRNVGLFRQTELEADILAVHLLARAGYPPELAARFWREAGGRLIGFAIRRRSHPPVKHRIAVAEAEAAKFRSGGELPPLPDFVAERNAPLDGEWRSLVAPSGRK